MLNVSIEMLVADEKSKNCWQMCVCRALKKLCKISFEFCYELIWTHLFGSYVGLLVYFILFFLNPDTFEIEWMEQKEAVKWKAPDDTHWLSLLAQLGFLFGVITPLLQMAWRLTKTT